jgi:hypothetical protein
MRHRFLIHSLSHTVLAVDFTSVKSAEERFPPMGEEQKLAAIQFQGWRDAERYFSGLGASEELLAKTSAFLARNSVAVLTIL